MREWSTLRKLMMLKGATGVPLHEYTATGNPLSFNTNVIKPLKSLLIPWTPVQSGSGDPYPPGGGKNKFGATIEQGTIVSGTGEDATSETRVRSKEFIKLSAGAYTISATGVAHTFLYLYDESGDFVSSRGWLESPNAFTLSETYNIRFLFRKSANNENITPSDISNVQLEIGSSATTYAPYSNIRPISGVSALNVWKSVTEYPITPNPGTATNNGGTITVNSDGLITVSGTPTNGVSYDMGEIRVNGTETLYSRMFGSLENVNYNKPKLYDGNGSLITTTLSDAELVNGLDLSQYPNTRKIKISIKRNANNVQMSGQGYLVVGTSVPEISPVPVVFPALGKNMFDKSTPINYAQYVSGVYEPNNGRILTDYIPVEYGKTYTFSVPTDNSANLCFINYNLFDAEKTWLGDRTTNGETQSFSGAFSNTLTVNLQGSAFIRLVLRDKSSATADISDRTLQNANLQFELGSISTSYEPYISAVYGGSLDLTTGVLTATYEIVDLGKLTWVSETNYQTGQFRFAGNLLPQTGKFKGDIVCDAFICQKEAQYNTLQDGKISLTNNQSNIIGRARNSAFNNYTANEFKSAVNGCMMAYELYTPVVVATLSPQQIATLLGDNVIWTDTNGSNTAVYLKKG